MKKVFLILTSTGDYRFIPLQLLERHLPCEVVGILSILDSLDLTLEDLVIMAKPLNI